MKKLFLLLTVATAGCFAAIFGTEKILTSFEGFEGRLTVLHNRHRALVGVHPLTFDPELTDFAANHAKWMATRRSLKHSDLEFPGQYRGENIAMTTHEDESIVMKNWLASKLHRNNLESSFYTRIGIGRYESRDGYIYWCAVFNGN